MDYPSGKKNVLVTGGAGFIGSHLCAELLKQNCNIICLDNYKTSSPDNIQEFLQFPAFEFVRHDLTLWLDLVTLKELEKFKIRFQGLQEVYHLATPASPADYTAYPWETLLACSQATINALEIADLWQAKFLLVSSPVVYGVAEPGKLIPENYWGYVDPFGYSSSYAEGKRFAETVTYWARKKRGMRTKMARVHNVYGPKMRVNSGRFIEDAIHHALKQGTIKVFNPTEEVCILHIDDCINGLIRLMDSDEAGPINLGGLDSYVLSELLEVIIHLAGSKSVIHHESTPPSYYHPQLVLDISRAKDKLGWMPLIKPEDGLRRTIEDIQAEQIYSLHAIIGQEKMNLD